MSGHRSWGLQRLGAELDAELTRHGPIAETARMIAGWRDAVGEAIARNAWPARVARDGTLLVNTVDSVWAFELGQRAPEIVARLGIRAVRFAPGPVPELGGEGAAATPSAVVSASPEERARAAEIAAPIEDVELRELVARAVAASLARAAADRRF